MVVSQQVLPRNVRLLRGLSIVLGILLLYVGVTGFFFLGGSPRFAIIAMAQIVVLSSAWTGRWEWLAGGHFTTGFVSLVIAGWTIATPAAFPSLLLGGWALHRALRLQP